MNPPLEKTLTPDYGSGRGEAAHAQSARSGRNLTALAPYQPIFVVATLGFLGAGFVMVYRKPQAACSIDGTISTRTTKIALWGATILIAAAIAFPYVTPLILDM